MLWLVKAGQAVSFVLLHFIFNYCILVDNMDGVILCTVPQPLYQEIRLVVDEALILMHT